MNETNLAPEAGIEASAISYSKGCYIGQEVIARIRTYGQVAKALRGLVFEDCLPSRNDKLVFNQKEIGYVTSAVDSLKFPGKKIGLGYARKECNKPGSQLKVKTSNGSESNATVVSLPFQF
jgi:folate-binding protein YgfZ